jgi:translation initiation factor 2 subunit 2
MTSHNIQDIINANFYDMLSDVYSELDNLNSNTSKLIIPDPIVKQNTTNTCWENVKKILQAINRPPEHFIDFLNKELKTGDWISSSKSDGILLIGKFKTSQIKNVIAEYIKQYVICNICKSTDTIIDKNKELRSYYLECNKCKSHYVL